ncbi:MAG: nuclear transport factor 2 family protein [Acidobacteriales bacterium]|nr:nuclear transport factor 2 family protein [Terriglobales bacterium]
MATQPKPQPENITKEIGDKLVNLCRDGKNLEAVETLYSDNIVSVEASGPPNSPREMRGKNAIRDKHHWWFSNMEVHSQVVEGPYPKDNQFIVVYKLDVTDKAAKKRFQMQEAGLYTVDNGKITREEFFYNM